MRERIQKVLAARGIGSRREVEAWIAAGRVTVNKLPATPGQAIGPQDEVRLDGRKLRLGWDENATLAGLQYHRPAREGIRQASTGTDRSTLQRLPSPPGGRWIPISPMGLGEGGLELFVNDGALAEAVMKASERLSAEFSVRVRGDFDETRLGEVREAAAQDIDTKGHLETLEFAGGEGANRWARLEVVGVRPRDIKRIFEQCGIEANRILRTRIGPIVLDRTLARGQGRRLTDAELEELAEAVGFVRKDATPARPARAARRPGRQSVSRDPRSKPARR